MSETSLTSSSESQRHGWQYSPVEGYWDEAAWTSGRPRRHWRKLAVAIGRMGIQQLSRSWQTGQQLIQASGMAYDADDEPLGKAHPWAMDSLPLIIAAEEWQQIERAVVQRATLLNAMLLDLYGEQRLIREQVLPPTLIFANPEFLRPCFGIKPPDGVHLHTYAADLARSPDGRWWVIADRAQIPPGMGYTLENRLASARTLPHVFNQCYVRSLARFFDIRRTALLSLAAKRNRSARIVLLTPGPHSETYFEDSFLAGYWGFSLVEGADLTVRDNHVYLKTLGGLEQVDLMIRQLDASLCDPLELRGDSLEGVPGLVNALRSGNVSIVNSLGSGLVESPAHMAFLPGLCRQILGEDLLLPSVATWWCGQEGPRRFVTEHLEQLGIKPAFPRPGPQTEFPKSMNREARQELVRRIEGRPEQYVAQEEVALSTAPVHTEETLEPRHVVLRVFAAWDGQSYSVMPGGLTRVSTEKTSLAASMQSGGGSKDTWVLCGSEEASTTPTPPPVTMETNPAMSGLPSRVADNLFWLGRYAERVEANVRLMRALLPALSGEEDFGRSVSLETATCLLIGLRYLPAGSASSSIGEKLQAMQRLLTGMIHDSSRTSSLGWDLKEMRRISWQVKERLSADAWSVLQQLEAEFSRVAPLDATRRLLVQMDLLDRAIMTLSAFSGLLMENTTRGFGWRFLEMGRRIERAMQTADLLYAGVAKAPAEIEPYLKVLLQIADSSITYRTRYLGILRTDLLLQLLLADEYNPRSIAFQMVSLLHQIDHVQEQDEARRRLLERPLALKVLHAVRMADMAELSQRDSEGRLGRFESLVVQMKSYLYELSDALTADYLSHLTASLLTSSS